MIYIIEGNTGAGKTTFINTLSGFEIRKLGLSSLQEIQDTLSNVNGIDKKKTILGREICEQEKVIFSQTVHRQYIGFNRLFSLMDVFIEKE